MGIKDFFKKKQKERFDPLRDLVLPKLKVGYIVDYDLKSWKVSGHNKYDWGEGEYSEEWELQSAGDLIYLEKEEDDGEIDWNISRKISLSKIERSVIEHIKREEDPPGEIIFEGQRYRLADSGAGYFIKGGEGPEDEFIFWDFEDDREEKILTIEQWGEDEFEISTGEYVEEYQFTNILPGGDV